MTSNNASKGVIVLRVMASRHRLKHISEIHNLSYKYVNAVACERKMPTFEIMNNLQDLIPVEFWFQEATDSFLQKLLKDPKASVYDFMNRASEEEDE